MSAQVQAQTKARPERLEAAERASRSEERQSLGGPNLLQRKCACGGAAGLSSACSECSNQRLSLQRRETAPASSDRVPPVVHEVLRSNGQPLDRRTRLFMEQRFGHDFSRVRVHTDARALESARAVNARAYTVGQDIVFGAGQFTPETSGGRQLLAHELTHIVQQHGDRPSLQALSLGEAPASATEREADEVGQRVAAGRTARVMQRASAARVHRMLSTEPAGGCGVCYGDPRLVGNAAHVIIQQRFLSSYPQGKVEVPFSYGGKLIRLDLFVMKEDFSFEIGEIKPANQQGYTDGILQLAGYLELFDKLFPNVKVRPLTRPIGPAIFPNPQAPPTCPPQRLYINPPVRGVYGYFCQPPFSQLIRDPRCSCRRRIDVPVPQEQKQTQEDKKKVKEEEKKQQEEKKPQGETSPEGVLVGAGATVAVLAALQALSARLLAQKAGEEAGKKIGEKIGGRVLAYAAMAAAVVLLASGEAEASLGPGESPLETLYKSLERKGTPASPELKKLLESDPALKARVEEALRSGKVTEAQLEMTRKMQEMLDKNLDKFSKEELEQLLTATEATQQVGAVDKLTAERLKQALAQKESGESTGETPSPAAAPGGGTGAGKQQAEKPPTEPSGEAKDPVNAPQGGAGPQTGQGTFAPAEEGGTPAATPMPKEVSEQLAKAPPQIRSLFVALTTGTKQGAMVNATVVSEFTKTLTLDPPLRSEEINTLIANARPAPGATAEEVLANLREAVRLLRPPKTTTPAGATGSTPAAPGGEAGQKTGTTGVPAGEAAQKPPATPPKSTGTFAEVGQAIAKKLKGFESLEPGRNQFSGAITAYQPGKPVTKFFAWRLLNGVLVGNYVTVTPIEQLPDGKWRLRIAPTPLFNQDGVVFDTLKGGVIEARQR